MKACKISSGDDTLKTRSLRRTKHAHLTHFGSTERRKKKLSLQKDQDSKKSTQIITSEKDTAIIEPAESSSVIEVTITPHSPLLPFDDHKEWAEIENIIASFGNNDVPNRISPCKAAQEVTELQTGMEGVRDFLFSINLPDYTPLLIAHGFDDIRFMGSNVLGESDLKDIVGVKSEEDVRKILSAARKRFPRLPLLHKTAQVSVDEWLQSLSLTEYSSKFRENGFTDMNKTRKIWEFELNAVLDITKVGHRKRILASLGERTSLLTDLGLDDLDRSSSVTPEPLTTIAVKTKRLNTATK